MSSRGAPEQAPEIQASTPSARLKESARLRWDSKPRKSPNARELEFQPAEVVFPNKAAGDTELLIPRTPEGEVDDRTLNRLIWGDNLLTMQALLAQGFEGKLDLVYIDPPFLTSEDYKFQLDLPGYGGVTKTPSLLERLAYRDTWDEGIDSYLDMLYPRLQLIRRLLTDRGTLYVHIGPNITHYVRALLDEVFSKDRFVNEIIWKRTFAHGGVKGCGPVHDSILVYSKGPDYLWNPQYVEYTQDYLDAFFTHKDDKGRYRLTILTGPGVTNGPSGLSWRGVNPASSGRHWAVPGFLRRTMQDIDSSDTLGALDRLDEMGRIHWPKKEGGIPSLKQYVKDMPGAPIQDVWTDIPPVASQSRERLGYPTQKPEALLERIISASSASDSIVADFFVGSGTTVAVADRLKRRWIASDFSKVAIQVARARLVEQEASPFVLENIGNYQRELIYREGGNIALMQRIVLRLYGAQPHPTHADLGILEQKGGNVLVYVGYPDRPLTAKKTAELVKTARTLDGDGYDRLVLLAWDYEYNYDEQIEIRRKGFGVHVDARLIPPSIYEYLRKAKDEEDLIEKFSSKIRFGSKPYLKLGHSKVTKRGERDYNISIGIEHYVLSEIPVEDEKDRTELQAISKGDQFAVLIDYWAVDWDYDGRTFRSRWQDYRMSGSDRRIVTTHANTSVEGGRRYDIAVRVVDVFGNDATATTSVDLR